MAGPCARLGTRSRGTHPIPTCSPSHPPPPHCCPWSISIVYSLLTQQNTPLLLALCSDWKVIAYWPINSALIAPALKHRPKQLIWWGRGEAAGGSPNPADAALPTLGRCWKSLGKKNPTCLRRVLWVIWKEGATGQWGVWPRK